MSSLWNYTIDDASPFLTYLPYADGSNSGLNKGWTPWYTKTGYLVQNAAAGDGDSYHITSLPGASVTLNFYGSAAFFYGTSNTTYSVTVDNQPAVSSEAPRSDLNLLFAINDLKEGTHSVTLTAGQPSSGAGSPQLAFDRAIISTPLINNQIPSELFYDNTDITMFKYNGDWSSGTGPGIPNSTVTHPFHQTFAQGSSVELDIDIGAVAVALWGVGDWGNGLYNVTLDGSEIAYNGSTFWEVPDSLLFYGGGLDPNKTHKLVVTQTSPSNPDKLALNSLRVYNISVAQNIASSPSASSAPANMSSASTPSAHSSTKSSTKVGVIVGPILAVVVLGLVGFVFWWRSRRNRLQTHSRDMTHGGYTDQPPHPVYAAASSDYPVTSPGYQLNSTTALTSAPASAYSVSQTHISGPPGATVMTWGPGVASYDIPPPSSVYTASHDYDSQTVARSSSYAPSSDGTTSDAAERRNIPVGKVWSPPPQPVAANPVETPDVDRLIELIAQRIDRGPRANDGTSPPEYRD
ncbi:hypothetical protein B0H16DRAFT_1887848 [Mycena metata]|uniref:Transmembrane protein n=1 Tax=Mycena metata TaxID=1033252 RepID=A0AAD7IWP4_9AGAR|nr:hypothetical protein B0H16DRAFT_1887848 [Mycena metata]